MTTPARVLITLVLLAVTAFCIFGFMATHEPPGSPLLRVVYALVGARLFTGLLGLLHSNDNLLALNEIFTIKVLKLQAWGITADRWLVSHLSPVGRTGGSLPVFFPVSRIRFLADTTGVLIRTTARIRANLPLAPLGRGSFLWQMSATGRCTSVISWPIVRPNPRNSLAYWRRHAKSQSHPRHFNYVTSRRR